MDRMDRWDKRRSHDVTVLIWLFGICAGTGQMAFGLGISREPRLFVE